MNVRFPLMVLGLAVLSACNQATGQKDRGKVVLKSTEDSVAYGIGSDIGIRVRGQLIGAELKDSLNMDVLAQGFRNGLDSLVPEEAVLKAMQNYQLAMQRKYLEREKVAAEKAIKEGEAWLTENGKRPGVTTTASGLQYEVISQGAGPRPTVKDSVTVNYRGTLVNGEEFDSSARHGGPSTFALTNVVAGWTEALQLMPTGSNWRLFLPAHLGADGLQGAPGIPPHSVLIFDVELVKVVKGA